MKIKRLTIPFIIAIFSFAVIYVSLQLELSPPMIVGESMQARSFPIFLMIINLGLVCILAVQFLSSETNVPQLQGSTTWGTMVLLLAFFLLTVTIDMFIAIPIVMFSISYLWGERRHLLSAFSAVITPTLIFFLFDLVLKVRFPRGILMDWYYG